MTQPSTPTEIAKAIRELLERADDVKCYMPDIRDAALVGRCWECWREAKNGFCGHCYDSGYERGD